MHYGPQELNLHRPVAWIFAAAMLMACSPQRLLVDQMVPVFENGMAAMERDSDIELLGRAFPSQIKQMEGMLASAPDNRRLLVLLSKAYAAYGYVVWDAEFEAMRLAGRAADPAARSLRRRLNRYYGRGKEYALQALEADHPQVRRRLDMPSRSEALLASADADDVPALFWYAFNLSAYVNVNLDSIRALAKAHWIENAMRRVIELDDTYYHGMAHLVLLAYYGSRPPAMGGDLEQAQVHYRRLQDVTAGQLWLADLYLARYVAYQRQDRAQYVDLLRRIIAGDESAPAYRLFNRVAQKRARIYLDATDRLFLEP